MWSCCDGGSLPFSPSLRSPFPLQLRAMDRAQRKCLFFALRRMTFKNTVWKIWEHSDLTYEMKTCCFTTSWIIHIRSSFWLKLLCYFPQCFVGQQYASVVRLLCSEKWFALPVWKACNAIGVCIKRVGAITGWQIHSCTVLPLCFP